MSSRYATEPDRFDDDALRVNDRDDVDDMERADPDNGWTSSYRVAVEVTVPSRVTLQTVQDEIASNIESMNGWTADSVVERSSALSPASAEILVRQMFNAFGERAYSAIAMAICDTVDRDRETFGPLHTAYARVKAEYQRRGLL